MPHVHNGLHEYTRLLDAAARAVGEKSGAQDFTGIERFGETLTPIMNLWALPEWALLRGEVMFSRRPPDIPAVAARNSVCELVNPAGSGVLAVVDLITVDFGSVDMVVDAGVAIAANPVVSRGVTRDGRYIAGEVSRCSITTGDAAAGTALPQVRMTANVTIPLVFVLQPGRKLFIGSLSQNVVVGLSLHWTERPLLPTEERA